MSEDEKEQLKGRVLNICVCFFPFPTYGTHIHISSVVDILQQITNRLVVISNIKPESLSSDQKSFWRHLRVVPHLRKSKRPIFLSALSWVLKYMVVQIEMSYQLIKISRKVDIVVLYEGTHNYVLPIIAAKLLRKKIAKYSPATLDAIRSYPKFSIDYWAYYILREFERTIFTLSDRIIIPKGESINSIRLEKYQKKVSAAMYMYIDNIFQERKDWFQRESIVGYVGRLFEMKGVLQLAKAIPIIVQRRSEVRFLIVGDGILMDDMKSCLKEAGCLEMVDFVGWVPNEQVPYYLNEMKFHILPSYWESPGASNLEAMACGTVAIANEVGGIPDIVIDNETGFLFKDNEPSTIANKVVEVLDHPELEKIRQNGLFFAKQNFSQEKVVDDWRHILSEL